MRVKDEELNLERKKKILESALALFCEKGYNKTSMNDIVKESGISKGGIYYYFENKEAIFCELGDNILENRKNILDKLPESLSSKEKLKAYIIKVLINYQNKEYQKDIKFGFEFWSEKKDTGIINGVDKAKFIDDRFRKASEDLNVIIKEGRKSGEFNKTINVQDFLFALHAAIDGTAFFVALLERDLTKNKIFILADIFCEYLVQK